ncbi:hypothetical protein R3P38DRAFT_3228124 [Favolaschia claudopus]|uniref:Uncharacterized protein n=1 Tax=Favolaschia claudopus TaxID=2862362 RepID=A0AAV9ZR99_9AGAR
MSDEAVTATSPPLRVTALKYFLTWSWTSTGAESLRISTFGRVGDATTSRHRDDVLLALTFHGPTASIPPPTRSRRIPALTTPPSAFSFLWCHKAKMSAHGKPIFDQFGVSMNKEIDRIQTSALVDEEKVSITTDPAENLLSVDVHGGQEPRSTAWERSRRQVRLDHVRMLPRIKPSPFTAMLFELIVPGRYQADLQTVSNVNKYRWGQQ